MFIRACRSQFIVGYQNLDQRAVGLTMSAPTFLQVSSETGCTLADLSVTGYEPSHYDEDEEDYVGGVSGGQFILQFLSSSGHAELSYYWIDDASKSISGGWYADANGTAIVGGASSVAIEKGRALWIDGHGYSLTTAGAVGTFDTAYVTRTVGLCAIGNNTPVNLTLGSLYVNGYEPSHYDEDEEDYVGGVSGGQFILSFLGPSGRSEVDYYWIDDASKGLTGGWYADANGTPIDGGAASVSIPAGKGTWVDGHGYTLNIPAPEL